MHLKKLGISRLVDEGNMQIRRIILGVFVLLILTSIAFILLQEKESRLMTSLTLGDQQRLVVEVAKTPATISLGLGNRDAIGSDGMLFVLPTRSVPTFWMKNMRFDLDFVWIDMNTIVDLTATVSATPGLSDEQLTLVSPKQPVTHVLELPAGDIARRNLRIGDSVVIH